MRRMLPVVVGAVLMLAPESTWAHHDFVAKFAPDQLITLTGTLTKVQWMNPHGWIYLDVKDAGGQVEHWAVETGTTHRLMKGGLTIADLKIGTEIVVTGFAARDGSRKAAGQTIRLPDRDVPFPLGR